MAMFQDLRFARRKELQECLLLGTSCMVSVEAPRMLEISHSKRPRACRSAFMVDYPMRA